MLGKNPLKTPVVKKKYNLFNESCLMFIGPGVYSEFFPASGRGFHYISQTVKVNATGIPQWGEGCAGVSNEWCICHKLGQVISATSQGGASY